MDIFNDVDLGVKISKLIVFWPNLACKLCLEYQNAYTIPPYGYIGVDRHNLNGTAHCIELVCKVHQIFYMP